MNYCKHDEDQSNKLREILRVDYKQYDTEQGQDSKLKIIAILKQVVDDWISGCIDEINLSNPNSRIQKSGGKIFTIGSYKLGVNGPNSDIDVLCIAPQCIELDKHFFGKLAKVLKDTNGIEGLVEIREALVPTITFKFFEVEIDLLFARVNRTKIDDDIGDLTDENILRGCDGESARSLAGARDTNMILRLLPDI